MEKTQPSEQIQCNTTKLKCTYGD